MNTDSGAEQHMYGHKAGKLALNSWSLKRRMSGSIQKFGDITPQTAAVPVPQLFISVSTASICILAAGKVQSSFEES